MTIQTELKRIADAKDALKVSIEAKGVEVGDGTIDTYASKVDEISSGGIEDKSYPMETSISFDISSNPESELYGPITIDIPEGFNLSDIHVQAAYDYTIGNQQTIKRQGDGAVMSRIFDADFAQTPLEINGVEYPLRIGSTVWGTSGYSNYLDWSMADKIYSNGIAYDMQWDDAVLLNTGVTLSFQYGTMLTKTGTTYFVPITGPNSVWAEQGYSIDSYTGIRGFGLTYNMYNVNGQLDSYGQSDNGMAGTIEVNNASTNLTTITSGFNTVAAHNNYIAWFYSPTSGTVPGHPEYAFSKLVEGKWGIVVFIPDGHTLEEVIASKPVAIYSTLQKNGVDENIQYTPQATEVGQKLDTLVAQSPRTLTFNIDTAKAFTNLAFKVKVILEGEVKLSTYANNGKAITVNIMSEWGDQVLDSFGALLLAQEGQDISDINEVKVGGRDM